MSDELFFPGAHAESRPDAIAYRMVGADGTPGAEVTYAELHERANRIAHLFRSLGLHPGDHVAFCLENHPWFLSLAWGAHYAGLYYTAISSRLTAEEIAYIVDDWDGSVTDITNFKYHGAGTGTTAEASGDTALVTESTTALNPDSTRATGTQSQPSANILQSVGTLTFDNTAAITEHGLFSQAATGGGTLWDRTVFSAINVTSGDSIQFTYSATLSAGG